MGRARVVSPVGRVETQVYLHRWVSTQPTRLIRLRAVLGRIATTETLTPVDLAAARPALPPVGFDPTTTRPGTADRLAEANAQPRADARWSGLSFRFLPLTDLP